jgi:predicted nucleotidyltransferase component of viral defense system
VRNATQLKALIRNIAAAKNVAPQALLQNYVLERLLERISVSSYRDRFILKGGMLIAAIVGLDSRTTMDMDATLQGMPLTEEAIREALTELLSIDVGDGVVFSMKRIMPIREDDAYGGYRVALSAAFDTINVPLKIDLTTGDTITPREVSYKFALMFEDREINILAYNLETILAEKYETILRRSLLNTRMRDFYDVYLLMNFQVQNIDKHVLKKAVNATAGNRKGSAALEDSDEVLILLAEDKAMQTQWELYQKAFSYAQDVSWEDCNEALRMMSELLS